ncbi:hypothetical protein P1X14_04060 [Sphingomonas sp. AOB5]|uniref:hypothetical protein n=1 Tax=Sphingomonas sp. AOB5 TaxID=3034017 RepID=UPI0023F66A4A|nr:hypothetical protein [Sphingomonas sp. AOB5]MDF7774411.1 hypothetical protein [Sphingomonas sp. AOB5]
MIAVLGSGFGCYGHVAMLASEGRKVATLARYRPLFERRLPLAPLIPAITWLEDEADALSAETLVLARRPEDNAPVVLAGGGKAPEMLVMEKPLAADPSASMDVIDTLEGRGVSFATPYLLLYCPWFEPMRSHLAAGGSASIEWDFRLAAASDSWKRNEEAGGGALAFYFIHSLAVAEAAIPGGELSSARVADPSGGETIEAISSAGDAQLHQRFTLGNRPHHFRVMLDEQVLFDAQTPFGAQPSADVADSRIPFLSAFYDAEVFGAARRPPAFHRRVVTMWESIGVHGQN